MTSFGEKMAGKTSKHKMFDKICRELEKYTGERFVEFTQYVMLYVYTMVSLEIDKTG